MTTLVTDGFEDETPRPHNIVYGATGWTDALSDETIDALLSAGVIVLDHVASGSDWESRLYRSVTGRRPE